ILFVVGLFAVVVAVGAFVLAGFGSEPEPAVAPAPVDEEAGQARQAERAGSGA
ncbi:MAG: hypothetical protein GX537_08305, partial [Actinobacteria bacterium]|nr:hypothetical protein [Actinomycetota bacterium]